MAAAHLAQIFAVPERKLLSWHAHEPEDLARSLLQSDEHQKLLLLQFYQNGWHRAPCAVASASSSDGGDPVDVSASVTATAIELEHLELAVEDAVRDFVPELQMQRPVGGYDPDDDARELYSDTMDAAHEHEMRTTLERHFARFRTTRAPANDASDVRP